MANTAPNSLLINFVKGMICIILQNLSSKRINKATKRFANTKIKAKASTFLNVPPPINAAAGSYNQVATKKPMATAKKNAYAFNKTFPPSIRPNKESADNKNCVKIRHTKIHYKKQITGDKNDY